MRLILARHGATANNLEGRYTGQADVPLSPLGLRQAAALADRLTGERSDLIVSSDLARARQTAEAIVRRNDAPLRLDADLREIAMGEWEGRTPAELADLFPAEYANWESRPEAYAPVGGETVLQLRDRAVQALERCRTEHSAGSVLWVTHGGLIGVLICHLLGLDLGHRWQFRKDNATLTELDVGPDYAVLMRLNEGCHLRALPGGEHEQVL